LNKLNREKLILDRIRINKVASQEMKESILYPAAARVEK